EDLAMSSIPHHHDHLSSPAALPRAERRSSNAGRWIGSVVPTVFVVAALIGLAVWGHQTDWAMPKFSALVGQNPQPAEQWCLEHNVPETECIECNVSLLPVGTDYGWCKLHGVAQCPFEHPDVAQLKSPPAITQAMLDRANRALTVKPRP